jgi:ion channel POLLUX/CASTOR
MSTYSGKNAVGVIFHDFSILFFAFSYNSLILYFGEIMEKKSTWRERLRYRFDNSFSKGPLVLIGWLALGTALLVIVMTLIALIPSIRPDGQDLKQVFWNVLFQTLTPNPFDASTRWQFLVVMLIVTLASLFIVSILIGTLTSSIEAKVDDLRKGRSRVLENDHTVILGWSSQLFTILNELMIANENKLNARIVILAEKDVVEMEDEVGARVKAVGSTRIIFRSGSPIDLTDLEIANPHTAKSIIILPPPIADPDAYIIKTILALTNNPNRRGDHYHIVTQIQDASNMDVVKIIGQRDRVQAVLTGDLIARVTAQTSRQSGLSVVYTELLNFAGDEIYFVRDPSLVGKTYGEALNLFDNSAVMGMKLAGRDAALNPLMDTIIGAEDKLFALSADDDTLIPSGKTTFPVDESVILEKSSSRPVRSEKCLILGWNQCAPTLIRELDNYVPIGSKILLVANPKTSPETAEAETILKRECSYLTHQQVIFHAGDTTDRRILEEVKAADFDHVIVLSYAGLEEQEADAKTLVTLLHLRDIAERDETPFSIVSEMLDLRNRELAEVTKVDDFIVSDHLISLMMSQLSEDGDLYPVFADIFDPEGSEIYLKPVSDYVKTGMPLNFYTLVEAARRRGESAIGYRLVKEANDAGRAYGVHTNPEKSELVVFSPDDKLIVVAEN